MLLCNSSMSQVQISQLAILFHLIESDWILDWILDMDLIQSDCFHISAGLHFRKPRKDWSNDPYNSKVGYQTVWIQLDQNNILDLIASIALLQFVWFGL